MCGHLAKPFDPAVPHRRVRIEALGNGVGDDGLPLFFQQHDQAPLFLNERVDLSGFTIEEGGDGDLLIA